MKLSEKEGAVIASVELRADAPIKLLTRESGLREHAFRYALRSLLERKVLAPVPFISLHRLGYTVYSIFFTVGGEKRGSHDALIRSLVTEPRVLWVGEFGGEYQFGIGVAVHRLSELIVFLDAVSKKHGAIFYDKAISVQISSTIFPRRYLSARKMSSKPLSVILDKRDPIVLDQLDRKILSAITTHSSLSHRQIALAIRIPLSTLELRVRKLKERGVIVGEVYNVDSSKFDVEGFKLLVYTKGLDSELTAKLYQFCVRQQYVTTLIDCLGSWGYEINVEVSRPKDLSVIVQKLYEEFGASIHTVKTLTRFGYLKSRFFPEENPVATRG
jgi:DNA-binding Lrp family transcriptional regulator